jgi:hypothetical protein
MLFHVVNDRHRKKRAMIFTTNKPLAAWGHVLHDEDLAHASVDRVLERGRMLTLDGPSMRTKHLGLDDPTANQASTQSASVSGEGTRISGIQRPEFPEPTVQGYAGQHRMTHLVEISLRIPSIRGSRAGNDTPATIVNNDVRFIKQVELESIPKAGDVLTMTVESAEAFDCEVIRSDWHQDKNMFVIACRYGKRSMSEAAYQTLLDAPDWQRRELL